MHSMTHRLDKIRSVEHLDVRSPIDRSSSAHTESISKQRWRESRSTLHRCCYHNLISSSCSGSPAVRRWQPSNVFVFRNKNVPWSLLVARRITRRFPAIYVHLRIHLLSVNVKPETRVTSPSVTENSGLLRDRHVFQPFHLPATSNFHSCMHTPNDDDDVRASQTMHTSLRCHTYA